MQVEEFQKIIAAFGVNIGVPDIAADETGYLGLGIDNFYFNIELDTDADELLVYAEIGRLPPNPTPADYKMVCDFNFMGLMRGVGGVAVETETGRILSVERWTTAGLDAAGLEKRLEVTLHRLRLLTQVMQGTSSLGSAKPPVPALDQAEYAVRI